MVKKNESLRDFWNKSLSNKLAILGILLAIIVPFLLFFLTPWWTECNQPTKNLEIQIGRYYELDNYTTSNEILSELYKKSANSELLQLYFYYGCGAHALQYINVFSMSEEQIREAYPHSSYYPTDILITYVRDPKLCRNCTYYTVTLVNKGHDILEPLTFLVNLSSDIFFDEKSSKINLGEQQNFPFTFGRSFLFTVNGGIKGNKSEWVSFTAHTEDFDELSIDCSNIKKAKCSVVKYDIGTMGNSNNVAKFLNEWEFEKPQANLSKLNIYYLNYKTRRLEKLEDNAAMEYFEEGLCKSVKPDYSPLI